ncbi:hypothetical protein JXB11_00375 [Candidatus Woesearchaeota archaeon]|nr:hypothetical protein [Candidatus Woesearchaeota archaeon]
MKRSSRDSVSCKISTFVDEENPFFRLEDNSGLFRHVTKDNSGRFKHATAYRGLSSFVGFYKNEEKQRQAAAELSDLLGFRGKVVDVGFGYNIHIAEELAGRGMEAYALDTKLVSWSDEVQIFKGSAECLGNKKDKALPKFNAILYWGSWFGEGHAGNHDGLHFGGTSIESYLQGMEDKKGRRGRESPHFAEAERSILEGTADKLAYGGQAVFVSNRYTYEFAPSYQFEELPEEKRKMLHVAEVMKSLGAEEIKFIGLSAEKLEELAGRHRSSYVESCTGKDAGKNYDRVIRRLCSYESIECSPAEELSLLLELPSERTKAEELTIQPDIARIDAIAARFYR